MPRLYMFPGFFGTELFRDATRSSKMWVSYLSIAGGYGGQMRLGGNGFSPGAPDGIQLYPGGPLPEYCGTAFAALGASMSGDGYTFVPQVYDWRLSLMDLALPAVADIFSTVTAEDPCTLFAYSFGGLVARRVWQTVVANGGGNLIRRVVTLGTPHYGSYAAVRLWSNDDTLLNQFVLLTIPALPLVLNPFGQLVPAVKSPSQIIALTCTWPALYDLLPIVGAPDAAADPLRANLFSASNWTRSAVQQQWLSQSLNVTGPFLLSAPSMPPPSILTTIGGTGIPTAFQLRQPRPIGNSSAYSLNNDGDGVVTLASALGPAQFSYIVHQRHADLPLATIRSGLVRQAILEARPAPPPPPVVATQSDIPVPHLGGPPVPMLGYGFLSGGGNVDC